MGSIYLIRHGQASFGQAEYDALSPVGVEQAGKLGLALKQRGLRFQQAFQGTMKRHQETARLCLAEIPDAPVVETDAFWNEFDHQSILQALHPDFADSEKLKLFLKNSPDPARLFHKEFEKAMERWMAGLSDQDYAETWQQFKQRCQAAVENRLKTAAADANIVVFTSGGPISSLMGLALNLSDPSILRLNGAIVNASITRLPFKGNQLFVAYFNDYAHFEMERSALITHR